MSAFLLWGAGAWMGCQAVTDRLATDSSSPPGATDTAESPDDGPAVVTLDAGDQDLDDSWIFSLETVHTIDITLPQASIDGLNADAYTYVPGGVTFDGETIDDIGVRLRGKFGSFRSLAGKPKFKLDLNQYVEDQRFWGLETLSLNNEVVDYSYLKEPLAYRLMAEMGVPAPRTGFAQVTVNGEPYGLYVLIETPDDRFLKRAYERPDGNLYDGKYLWDGCCNYTLLDFADGLDDQFPLEEGTDVDNEDVRGVSTALINGWGQESWDVALGTRVNWDEILREFAVEQWIGQNDGYCLNTNNYRVYFDPETGKADIVPWDFDYSFLQDSAWGMDWSRPRGNLAAGCLADVSCRANWKAATAQVLVAAETADLIGLFDSMQAVILEAAQADPRREVSWSSVESEQAKVRTWLQQRSGELRAEWDL